MCQLIIIRCTRMEYELKPPAVRPGVSGEGISFLWGAVLPNGIMYWGYAYNIAPSGNVNNSHFPQGLQISQGFFVQYSPKSPLPKGIKLVHIYFFLDQEQLCSSVQYILVLLDQGSRFFIALADNTLYLQVDLP